MREIMVEIMSLLLTIERQQTDFLHSIGNSRITLQFGIHFSSKTMPDLRPKWAKSMSVFRPKRRKTLPVNTLGAAHTYTGLYMGVTRPGRFCYLIFGSLCYLKRKLLGSIYRWLFPDKWSCSCSINSKCGAIICNVEASFLDFNSAPNDLTPKKPWMKSQRADTSTSMNNPYNYPFESYGLNLDGSSAHGILSA